MSYQEKLELLYDIKNTLETNPAKAVAKLDLYVQQCCNIQEIVALRKIVKIQEIVNGAA